MKQKLKVKSVVKLKTRIKFPHSFPWNSFINYYKDKDDRVTAIVFASMLEAHTEDYLQLICKYPLKDTFQAFKRIELLYSLGKINEYIYEDLKLIAQIRNKFAHNFEVNSFERPEVKQLVLQLAIAKDSHDVDPLMPDNLTELKKGFVKSAIVCQAVLQVHIWTAREAKEKEAKPDLI